MYVLNMRGCKPTYYDEYDVAFKKYLYMRKYFSGVSFGKINHNRFVKDVIVTKRTI